MPQGAITAIAGNGTGVHMDDFGRGHLISNHGRCGRWGGAVRHVNPLSGLESGAMIAMLSMLSTMFP
jgi:hypothetical protein